MLRELSPVNHMCKDRVIFVKAKNRSVTLVKDGQADFIQLHCDRYRKTTTTAFYSEGVLKVNSKYSIGKWEFIAKGQGIGAQCIENY